MATRLSYTTDELVGLLKRSSLPTILVEGSDDMTIYRWLENTLRSSTSANVLPCGGRPTLLAVFERRQEFSGTPTAFLADRDMWLYSSIPSHLTEVVWTTGYSIENDAYLGSTVESLLDPSERTLHSTALDSLVRWFAFAVQDYLASGSARVAANVARILSDSHDLAEPWIQECCFVEPDPALLRQVRADYQIQVRGKQLFELLARFLSAPSRSSKFSKSNLLEIACKVRSSDQPLSTIVTSLESRLTFS